MAMVPEPTWPPCDVCGQEESIASIMILASYQTTRLGPACLPDYFRWVAGQVDGTGTDPAPPAAPAVVPAAPAEVAQPGTEQCPMCGDSVPLEAIPAHVEAHLAEHPELADAPDQGSARDHWASTTNVRRSTHGHRKPRGAAAAPEQGAGE